MTGGVDVGPNPRCDFLFTPGQSCDRNQQFRSQTWEGPVFFSRHREIKPGSCYDLSIQAA